LIICQHSNWRYGFFRLAGSPKSLAQGANFAKKALIRQSKMLIC